MGQNNPNSSTTGGAPIAIMQNDMNSLASPLVANHAPAVATVATVTIQNGMNNMASTTALDPAATRATSITNTTAAAAITALATITPITGTIEPTPAMIQAAISVDYLTKKIPNELLLMICKQITTKKGSPDWKSLANLKVTCKKMAPFVNPIFFREITIGESRHDTKLISLLRVLHGNKELGASIQRINLSTTGCSGTFSASDVEFLQNLSKETMGVKHSALTKVDRSVWAWADESTHALALLVALAPNAPEVVADGLHSLNRHILSRHHKKTRVKPFKLFEGVKNLTFHMMYSRGQFFCISEFLAATPNLCSLTLTRGCLWKFDSMTTFNAPNITELKFFSCQLPLSTLTNILKNFKSLKSFSFEHANEPSGYSVEEMVLPTKLLDLVRSSGNTLKHLCILNSIARHSSDLNDVLRGVERQLREPIEGFPELEEVKFTDDITPNSYKGKNIAELLQFCPKLKILRMKRYIRLKHKDDLRRFSDEFHFHSKAPVRAIHFHTSAWGSKPPEVFTINFE